MEARGREHAACPSPTRVRSPGFTMAFSSSSPWIWIVVALLTHTGVHGRAVHARGSEPRGAQEDAAAAAAAAPRGPCAELAEPWMENTRDPGDNATTLRLRARAFSGGDAHGLLFPGKGLFSFVRRVYQCCRGGAHTCRRVKGVQGRLRAGREVEFPLSREILSLSITRAELHLQLSNPQHLDIRPALLSLAKRNLPTRYNVRSWDERLELRVDLLSVFQKLQEAAGGGRGPGLGGPSLGSLRRVLFSPREDPPGGAPRSPKDIHSDSWGDGDSGAPPALELGLMLGCSGARAGAGEGVSCGSGGVHLSHTHTPFLALYYR